MPDLRELYQELIIDHGRRPRNFGPLPAANRRADGFNPLCGDRLTLYLRMDGDLIADARFEGVGCAISTASASLMTEALKGKTATQAEALFAGFHALVTGVPSPAAAALGKLEVLGGVRDFPARVKCATLAWHTLDAALHDEATTVSTEEEP
ncbi:MAG: Fe-S cluster assembly sulfur transfer protein SufU [Ignavibacteria bacterium]